MKKIKLTTAQALIKFLDNQYISFNGKKSKLVEGVWSVFGHGNVLGIGEALTEIKNNLKFHQGYNEQSMGHIAIGFAKQNKNKKIYVVTSSVGPGAANMVTSAATATANRIPVLFIPGDVFSSRQPDPVLQQIEKNHNLSISTNDAFKAVSVYWDRIDRPEKLMSTMINAMRSLTDFSNQGAVTVAFPQDVQGEAYDFPESFFQKRVHEIFRPTLNKKDLKDILEIIEKASFPLIIVGGGTKYSEAENELKKLVEKTLIPFAETQAGKGTIESNHMLNLGGIGTTGFIPANLYAKKADLIIGLGTRYSDFTTASKSLFSEKARFISINLSRFDAYKMDSKQVIADIKDSLKKILSKVKPKNKTKYYEQVVLLKKKGLKERERLFNLEVKDIKTYFPEVNDSNAGEQIKKFYKKTNSKFTQTNAIGVINKLIEKNSVIVAAAGSLPGDLQKIWQTKSHNSYHVEYGYSCMGYEIAASLGAKLANKDKEVYAMVGDGSYMMLHSALLTSVQENKKITVFLFNNAGFGCINNLQISKGLKSLGTEFRERQNNSQFPNGNIVYVNYSKQACGYGIKTFKVKNPKELEAAISDAKKEKKSCLIEIVVLPKTMTHDYYSWWRVGNPQVSKNKNVNSNTLKDQKIKNLLKGY